MTSFIDRLVQAARHAGVEQNQAAIARSLDLQPQTVNRWFKQGGEPGADLLLEIAKRYGVDADWLKGRTSDMLPQPSDGLSQEERELVKSYRMATPQARRVISTMVRAARKSIVTIAWLIPPLLAPQHADAIDHNILRYSNSLNFMHIVYVRHIVARFLRWVLGMPTTSHA